MLILAPLRSSALTWMQHLVSSLPSSITQVENYPRFVSEYSLPEGARDKVLEERDKYPSDHVEIWKGNVDDSFRVGVKVTRKSVKVFSNFYESDMLIASPLGLRTSIEKDGCVAPYPFLLPPSLAFAAVGRCADLVHTHSPSATRTSSLQLNTSSSTRWT